MCCIRPADEHPIANCRVVVSCLRVEYSFSCDLGKILAGNISYFVCFSVFGGDTRKVSVCCVEQLSFSVKEWVVAEFL